MEANETRFCSLWTQHIRIHDCAELFVNEKLTGDYFFNRLILLLSYFRINNTYAELAGCAALFANHGIMGLYCLGTISNFRGRGLAKKMIGVSLQIAQQKQLDFLFLQTFTNEGLFLLYK